jgi:hypothetical protein
MDYVLIIYFLEKDTKNFMKIRTFEIKPFILAQDLQLKIK